MARVSIPIWTKVAEASQWGDFWLGVTVAKNAATGTKPPDRRHRVLSIVGGIAFALLIGGGLFIAAALNA